MTGTVTVTDRAARRIAQIAAADPATPLLRVSVEGGGCSGFQYKFDLVRDRADDDLVLEKAGATVLIDPVSAQYMEGAEIDFVDDLIVRLRHELFGVSRPLPRGSAAPWHFGARRGI